MIPSLPYAPPAHQDELLSSWTERIGIFYGIGYLRARMMLDPSRNANFYGENEDFDASEDLRRCLALWTGHGETKIPQVLHDSWGAKLDVPARLAYCAECWLDDARAGRSPYIRRSWSAWSTVLCAQHRTWLSARRPGAHRGSELNGWAPVWQSNPVWATAAYLKYDPAVRELTRGFDSEMVRAPCCGWDEFLRVATVLARDSPILAMASDPMYARIRAAVWEAIGESNSAQFSDLDVRGYRGDRPGWISDRICCFVLAAELVTLISDEAPIFQLVRGLIEARPEASKLVFQSRSVLEDPSFCQFPVNP